MFFLVSSERNNQSAAPNQNIMDWSSTPSPIDELADYIGEEQPGEILGSGTYGVVFLTKGQYAVKFLWKTRESEKEVDREILLHREISENPDTKIRFGKNFARFYGWYHFTLNEIIDRGSFGFQKFYVKFLEQMGITHQKARLGNYSLVVIVMEYVRGIPVYEFLDRLMTDEPNNPPLSQTFALLEIYYQLVRVLYHIHSLSIYHGDLHMGNVLIRAESPNEDSALVLIDFGLACKMTQNDNAQLSCDSSDFFRHHFTSLDEIFYRKIEAQKNGDAVVTRNDICEHEHFIAATFIFFQIWRLRFWAVDQVAKKGSWRLDQKKWDMVFLGTKKNIDEPESFFPKFIAGYEEDAYFGPFLRMIRISVTEKDLGRRKKLREDELVKITLKKNEPLYIHLIE